MAIHQITVAKIEESEISMRKIEVTITYKYEIEVNDNNDIVKEYEDDKELINDLASYHFSPLLPVVGVGSVIIKDIELIEIVSINAL
jgi:hypothetical protein